jgi:excisionase family DNA binding protein
MMSCEGVETMLSPEEVARRLGVHRYTVLRWLKKGNLPGLQIGRTWRVRWTDVEALIQHRRD